MRTILDGLSKRLEATQLSVGLEQEDPHLRAVRLGWTRVLAFLATSLGEGYA